MMWLGLWTPWLGSPCWSGCTYSMRWLCSPVNGNMNPGYGLNITFYIGWWWCWFVWVGGGLANPTWMQFYRSSFAVSKSLLALFLSWQGFISIDFEWTFLHLKSLIDQITRFTFKSAKFEAFIAAMHWHLSKSTFLLEQFFNSENIAIVRNCPDITILRNIFGQGAPGGQSGQGGQGGRGGRVGQGGGWSRSGSFCLKF